MTNLDFTTVSIEDGYVEVEIRDFLIEMNSEFGYWEGSLKSLFLKIDSILLLNRTRPSKKNTGPLSIKAQVTLKGKFKLVKTKDYAIGIEPLGIKTFFL